MGMQIMEAVLATGRGKKGDDEILMENKKKCQQPNFFFFARQFFFSKKQRQPGGIDLILETGKSRGVSSTTRCFY